MRSPKGRRGAVEAGAPTRDQLLQANGRLQGQLDLLMRSRRNAVLASLIKTLIRCSCVFGCVWALAYYLAGRTTNLTAHVNADLSISTLKEIVEELSPRWWYFVALFTVTAVSGGVGVRQRRTIKTLVGRIGQVTEAYEKLIDPARSSSGISKFGVTHERDEV